MEVRKIFSFAYGGKVEGFDVLAEKFDQAGGVGENKFVSDSDLLSLYAASDLVWALYAEDYDQASGIFGRAAQLGIPVIVRIDSLLHGICKREGIKHIALNKDNVGDLKLITLDPVDLDNGRSFRNKFRSVSVSNLFSALGLDEAEELHGQ
jgi:hypothetical protein